LLLSKARQGFLHAQEFSLTSMINVHYFDFSVLGYGSFSSQ
jgi:hypothetical protein